MTSDQPLPSGNLKAGTTSSFPGAPPIPPLPPGEPVSRVDWFRRAPNGGTVNFAPPATSEPPHDPVEATTEP